MPSKLNFELEMTVREFKRLADYLSHHEEDIAMDINDFGDLRGIYIAIFETDPKERE